MAGRRRSPTYPKEIATSLVELVKEFHSPLKTKKKPKVFNKHKILKLCFNRKKMFFYKFSRKKFRNHKLLFLFEKIYRYESKNINNINSRLEMYR